MTSPQPDYPSRKDRKNPPYRSGRWLFGMLLVIAFVLFALAVFVGARLAS